MSEQWRPIAGYEELYEVSDMGRVRSIDRTTSDGRRIRGRVLRAYPNNHGYINVHLSKHGKATLQRVHALVLEAFIGPRPPGAVARHYPNPSKTDNRLVNLRWGTQIENEADKEQHGTKSIGERHWNAFLSEQDVRRIMELVQRGVAQAAVARQFGVSATAVNSIVKGKTWRHVGVAS